MDRQLRHTSQSMTASKLNPADHELTQAAKYIHKALHIKRNEGDLSWAERLSIAMDLLSAPNLQEPVLPAVPSRVHPKYERPKAIS